jgi:hypothetical protein
MLRNALFASAIALGALATSGVATAQDRGPRLVGGGNDAEVVYAVPSRNVVGGGVATISGGGEDQQIVYRPAAPAAASTMFAGQPSRRGG